MAKLLENRMSDLRPSTASNILLAFILAIVVVFLIWAALTELDVVVRGQGRVIPSSELQIVSNLEGGIVEGIFRRRGRCGGGGRPAGRARSHRDWLQSRGEPRIRRCARRQDLAAGGGGRRASAELPRRRRPRNARAGRDRARALFQPHGGSRQPDQRSSRAGAAGGAGGGGGGGLAGGAPVRRRCSPARTGNPASAGGTRDRAAPEPHTGRIARRRGAERRLGRRRRPDPRAGGCRGGAGEPESAAAGLARPAPRPTLPQRKAMSSPGGGHCLRSPAASIARPFARR